MPKSDLAPTPQHILLVEPFLHVHAHVHLLASLKSTGYENARFTLLTATTNPVFRKRLEDLAAQHGNMEIRVLDNSHIQGRGRLATMRLHHLTFLEAERWLGEHKGVDMVAYLMIDYILPFLAAPLSKHRYPNHRTVRGGISGIVFRDNGLRAPVNDSWKERAKRVIDGWILHQAVRKGWFRRLAFFDHRNVEAARRTMPPQLCQYGVDPIEIPTCHPAGARERLGLSKEERVALMFGSISDRKGIVETLDILIASPEVESGRYTLLMGGPVEEAILPRLEQAIKRARAKFRVVFNNGFVADETMPLYFASADVVICAYKNFNASSGILLHAAAYGKPALVSEGGVMDDAVSRFGFGEVASLSQPGPFAEKFLKLMSLPSEERELYRQKALKYATGMDARRYLSQFE